MVMGIAIKAGDYAFKALTAGLGMATVYLTVTFSMNLYTGVRWHNAQSIPSSIVLLLLFLYTINYWSGWTLRAFISESKFTTLHYQKIDKQGGSSDEQSP